MKVVLAMVLGLILLAGCGREGDDGGDPATDRTHPDVIEVRAAPSGDDTFAFTVTISSPYDTPERYADGWRVVGPDGTEYGEHTLMHDHQNEQPFTRTQSDVAIPAGVDEVTIEGRDSEHGYGGGTVTVELDPQSETTSDS